MDSERAFIAVDDGCRIRQFTVWCSALVVKGARLADFLPAVFFK